MALKALRKIMEEDGKYQLETVDILTNPGRAWKDGVRMIPTVAANGKKLSGIMLGSEQLRTFLAEADTSE